MRVLMMGWEFPPHISGGLGTACLGLTRGLVHEGVDVLFVVPRAYGDEEAVGAKVIGGNQVPVPAPADAAAGGTLEALGSLGALALADSDAAEVAGLALRLRVLPLDSPLTPYLTEAEYRERVARLASTPSPGSPGSGAAAGAAEVGGADRTEVLSFTGSYGPDLMAEVARYARVVAEVAQAERFDVIHAHDWMTYPAAVLASRVAHRPLVAHMHASEYDRSGENVNPAVRDIEQMGLEAADRVICVSHYLASLVRRRYGIAPGKIRVVHNAVAHGADAEPAPERPIPEPVVLFLGRVTFQKGPDYFLEAAARVLRLEPDVKFVVSGSGDMLPRVIEQAAALGIARNVHFTGCGARTSSACTPWPTST
jgi:glycogen(starch) synthase